MNFCKVCGNMYYLKLAGAENDNLIYYCRNCGDENNTLATTTTCVSNTVLRHSTNKYERDLNAYTKMDPTLPRTTAIRCPNQDCLSNIEGNDVEKEVIYLRYDDERMKYVYICTVCNTTWKTNDES